MRERWFYVQGGQRRGPFSLAEIVAAVRGEPDPRAVLVWRKGLRDWTLAEVIPEVDRSSLESQLRGGYPAPHGRCGRVRPAATPARTPALVRLRVGVAVIAAVAGTAAVLVQLHSSEPRVPAPGSDARAPVASVTRPPAVPAPAPRRPPALPPEADARRPPLHDSEAPAPPLAADEADLPGAELAQAARRRRVVE